jgi:hypothetical protein
MRFSSNVVSGRVTSNRVQMGFSNEDEASRAATLSLESYCRATVEKSKRLVKLDGYLIHFTEQCFALKALPSTGLL